MKEFLLKIWRDERFQSFLHTLCTEVLWDAAAGAGAGKIIGGDLSSATLGMFGYALFRTLLRVVRDELKKYYPKNE